ncbi:hypothetical protein VTN02DRAFT_1379 [Thermoascus thermophilus]
MHLTLENAALPTVENPEMSRKLIFLMGTPTPGSLNWDEDELLDGPIPPFSGEQVSDRGEVPPSDAPAAKWRLLPDRGLFEQTSAQDRQHEEPLFLTTQDLLGNTTGESAPTATGDTSDTALSQFYDHSMAMHEESRVSFSESTTYLDSTHDETSLLTEEPSTRGSLATPPGDGRREVAEARFPPLRGRVSDLQDLPSAGYLRSIVPQTMTVNLIVGIIAVYPPRRVTTRRWKREMDVVELVVGDETRTGFGLTFWLPRGQDGLGQTLAARSGTGCTARAWHGA